MGWSARPDSSIWSPPLASILFGFGILCVFKTTNQYLIDTYEIYAANAFASITFFRYIVSGAFIEFSIPFYGNVGVPYTLTILGSLSAILAIVPDTIYRYGVAVWQTSTFVPEFEV